jgi:hypothetical protein
MRFIVSTTLVFLFSFIGAGAQDVTFTAKPAIKRVGNKVQITFAVSGKTDVEVAVMSASPSTGSGQANVVRHLAAGVVGGEKAPPAPLKQTFDQSLEWDGTDDLGKPAALDGCKVRIRAGMGVKFSRLIGEDPYIFGGINSIVTDEEGNLYAMGHVGGANQNYDCLRVFTPDGKYIRTALPFPADLPPEAASAAAAWSETNTTFCPKNSSAQLPNFYPWGSGARIAGASKKGGMVLTHGVNVFRMDPNGGNVKGPMPMWSAAAKVKNPAWNIPQLAVSSDGRYIYYANVAGTLYQPKTFSDTDAKWPQGRVYRQDTSKPGVDPEPFFDLTLPDWTAQKYWLPDAWNKRTAAYGISLDAKGSLYVCDLVNQQVVEVGTDGKQASATPVPWPERVHVNAAGEYYVVCRLDRPKDGYVGKKLVKISGRGAAGKVVAELPLKGAVGEASALGVMGGKPVLWLGGGGEVVCVRDAGAAFETVETAFKPKPDSQLDWNRIATDYERDEIYTSNGVNNLWRYDGKTGKGEILRTKAGVFLGVDLAVGYDGLLYIRTGGSYSGPFERYTRDLAPAPFASGSHVMSPHIYSRFGVGNCEKGVGVGPKGESYVNFMYGWNKYFIAGFDGAGKPIKGKYLKEKVAYKAADMKGKPAKENPYPPDLDSAVVGPITASSGGIRVDLQGNIYLGLRLLPKDWPKPAGFEKDPAYGNWTGSIVKFPPSGGSIAGECKDDDDPSLEGTKTPVDRGLTVVNALAIYPGTGPFSGNGWGGGGSCCVCRVPRFDVDRYGRIVFPNAVTTSVRIVDNAGNLIAEFGKYGNFDSQYVNPETETGKAGGSTPSTGSGQAGSPQGKPTVSLPEIPLAWPTGAGFTVGGIYVNDTYNRRIVKVVPTWQAEVTCPVP